jgi:hypothetical protein
MSEAEHHAWRCSPAFADAIVTRREESRLFVKNVVAAWNEQHDPVKVGLTVNRPWSMDQRVLGFFPLSDGTVPDGLHAAKKRSYLLPARGPAGKFYRDELARLDRIPGMNEVFTRFNVSWYELAGDRVYGVGLTFTDTGTYLSCVPDILGGKLHSELTPVKLSVFYAAKERQDEIEAPLEAGG